MHSVLLFLSHPAGAAESLTAYEKGQPSAAARELISRKDYRRALLVLQANIATNANPKRPAKILVGDWYLDPTGQDLAFRELTGEQLRNIHFADMHNLAGGAYYGLRKLPEAEASYRKAIALNPQHGLAFCNLGGILLKEGRLDEAFAAFNKAIEINERYQTAYAHRALIHRAKNHFDLERKDLEAFNRWRKQNVQEQLSLSYVSRFQCMHAMISEKPPTARKFVALGVMNKEMHRLAESEKCYLRAIELNRQLPEAHWVYGELLTAQKKYSEAIKELTKAISLDSSASIIYFSRAIAYSQSRQFSQAMADYSKVIELNPKAPGLLMESYFNRAGCRGELKDFASAVKDINQALALKPQPKERALMLSNRGAMYEGLGNKDQAVKDYEQAIALSPNDKRIYARRGKIMLALGEYEQATVDLGTSSSTDVAEVSKEPPSAADLKAQIAHYDKLIKMFPRTASDSLYNRGLLYLTMGDAVRAAADMKVVVAQSKEINTTADYAVCYGSIALRMQEKTAAADEMLKAYGKRPRREPAPKEVEYFMNRALFQSKAQSNGQSNGQSNDRSNHQSSDQASSPLRAHSIDRILVGDDKHKTRVLTLLGLDAYSRNDRNSARKYLSSVRNSGDPSMDEFAVAASYLKRLGQN